MKEEMVRLTGNTENLSEFSAQVKPLGKNVLGSIIGGGNEGNPMPPEDPPPSNA